MRDVMIDLETLSTRPDAMIVSIGAVVFGPDGLGEELHAVIDPVGAFGHIDPSTVSWWLGQSEEARHTLSTAYAGERVYLHHALERLSRFFRELAAPPAMLRVWGHGSSFDLPIIENAFRACAEPIPWGHRAGRDTRTILELGSVKVTMPEHAKHNAVEDARAQAEAVIAAARAIGTRRLWPEAAE